VHRCQTRRRPMTSRVRACTTESPQNRGKRICTDSCPAAVGSHAALQLRISASAQICQTGVLAGPRLAAAVGHGVAAALTGRPVAAVGRVRSALRVAVVAVVPFAERPVGMEYAALCAQRAGRRKHQGRRSKTGAFRRRISLAPTPARRSYQAQLIQPHMVLH